MEVTRKEMLTSKGLVVFASMTFLYLGKKYIPSLEVECIRDPVHESLAGLNTLVNTNQDVARFLQITSSFLMDIVFLTLFAYWVIHVSTGRVVYAIGLFYGVRAITQLFSTLRFPQGYYWEYPGVPSIVVPYGRTSDFFYSGHCGFLNLCALEWLRIGRKDLFKVVQGVNIYMAFVMLIFRIHYMIDITTALVMSHYTYILVEQQLKKFDQFIYKIFLLLFRRANPQMKLNETAIRTQETPLIDF